MTEPRRTVQSTVRLLLVILSASTIFSLVLIIRPPLLSYAETADELRQKIDSRNSEIEKIEKEIEQYKQEINGTQATQRTLKSTIASIDAERSKLAKDIELTDRKIDRTRLAVMELDLSIKQKQIAVERSHRTVEDIIRRVAETDDTSLIEVLLSYASITEFFTDTDDMMRLQSGIGDHIASLERLRNELANEKAKQEDESQRLQGLSNEIEDQKRLADQKRKEENDLLAETKNKESGFKTLLADREKRKKQFETEIGDYEAQLKAIIDPNSIPKPGTKVLAYPMDGPITITQKFGKTVDAHRLYESGTHNGIDFRAAPGTPILAAAGGVVMGAGDTDLACRWASYGKWILIGHDNGLASLYGHLSLIKVGVGKRVETGELIGYSGNTGYSTGPHLHLTLFAKSAVEIGQLPSKSCPGAVFTLPLAPHNAYLDPEAYL